MRKRLLPENKRGMKSSRPSRRQRTEDEGVDERWDLALVCSAVATVPQTSMEAPHLMQTATGQATSTTQPAGFAFTAEHRRPVRKSPVFSS